MTLLLITCASLPEIGLSYLWHKKGFLSGDKKPLADDRQKG